MERPVMIVRKARALAYELIVGFIMLFVMGLLFYVLSPVLTAIMNTMQLAMGVYVSPDLFSSILTIWKVSVILILLSISFYILLAGMKRNPGEEDYGG
ncbi:MAG: hypothetical protein JRM78_03255 [Nitrososphaerota archaeon]|nr:hypothetical protein [Nitrososphaerota archaeon]